MTEKKTFTARRSPVVKVLPFDRQTGSINSGDGDLPDASCAGYSLLPGYRNTGRRESQRENCGAALFCAFFASAVEKSYTW